MTEYRVFKKEVDLYEGESFEVEEYDTLLTVKPHSRDPTMVDVWFARNLDRIEIEV